MLHVGQVPLVAGFPFFNVTDLAFCISLLLLHFTQYPVVMVSLLMGGDISGMLLKLFYLVVIGDPIILTKIHLSSQFGPYFKDSIL